jgi:hypothetical protein
MIKNIKITATILGGVVGIYVIDLAHWGLHISVPIAVL